MENKHYLPQIDGLRALAVFAVIIYHYNEKWLPSGYLGVDVFFVISGFVITGYLTRTAISSWPRYLAEFYARRIRRLFPALFVCIIFSSLALIALTSRPASEVFRTGALSLAGLSNVYLYLISADYFSVDATLNAFTHTWSLGVEEQFYLFFPLLIGVLGLTAGAGKNHKRTAAISSLALLSFLSLVLFIFLSTSESAAAFYLLPARIWELGFGGTTFLLLQRAPNILPKNLSFICLAVVVFIFFLPSHLTILSTIITVTATALLLFTCKENTFSHLMLTAKPAVFIGLLSYSLYIWHWPILVIGKLSIGSFGWGTYFLLGLTLLLACLSYYLIERPLRYSNNKSVITPIVAAMIAILLAIPFFVYISNKTIKYNNILATQLNIPEVYPWPNEVKCHGRKSLEAYTDPLSACLEVTRTVTKPNAVYLIGDSHAAQFFSMFEKVFKNTKYTPRFINTNSDFPFELLKSNKRSTTLEYIVRNSAENDIVVITFHRGYLNPSRDKHIPLREKPDPSEKTSNFIKNVSSDLTLLANKKVNILFIRDTPLMSTITTSPSCYMQIKLFGESACQIRKDQDLHTRTRQDLAFDSLMKVIPYSCAWDPLAKLYADKEIFDVVDSDGLYTMYDWNHLSKKAAESLSNDFSFSIKTCFPEKS